MPSINQDTATSQIIVAYPVREAQQVISVAGYRLIRKLEVQKVLAIKFIREQYNLGLYEAKMLVDTIHEQPDIHR